MNNSITTWLLAGALAASLAWNAKSLLPAQAAPEVPQSSGLPDWKRLDLSADQTRALESWCATSCGPSCQLDREADAKLEELHTLLRDPSATPASLRELAAEVSRLRAHSLEACVDSILEVRRVLTPAQLDRLMQCCELPTVSTR